MSRAVLDTALSKIETLLTQVAQATADNRVDDLAARAAELQRIVMDFSKYVQRLPNPADKLFFKDRLIKVSGAMGARREVLLRQSSFAERALQTIMPTAPASTYAPPTSRFGRQPYGSVGRQSGEFKAFSA